MSERPLDEHGLPEGSVLREAWEVTPRQVKAMIDAGEDFVLIDCRTPGEAALARIEGARLHPMQAFDRCVSELADCRQRKLVVHCHLGVRSLRVTAALREQGFEDVMSMAGGIELWSRDIDATVPRY